MKKIITFLVCLLFIIGCVSTPYVTELYTDQNGIEYEVKKIEGFDTKFTIGLFTLFGVLTGITGIRIYDEIVQ